jgi:hypothetical protein
MEWGKLTKLTGGEKFTVERVRTVGDGIAIEGDFELPPLACLDADDQAFVSAFVHCHGSIKQMESWFGVSYPTIKSRLNRIASRFDFVEMAEAGPAQDEVGGILDRLEEGDISADEALAELEQ